MDDGTSTAGQVKASFVKQLSALNEWPAVEEPFPILQQNAKSRVERFIVGAIAQAFGTLAQYCSRNRFTWSDYNIFTWSDYNIFSPNSNKRCVKFMAASSGGYSIIFNNIASGTP